TRVANFMYKVNNEAYRNTVPSREVVQDLLALRTYPGIPTLDGVVESPVLRPDGTILDQPGYDLTTRLFYAPPPGFVLPPLPAAPTQADVQQAAAWLLTELFSDFPFASDAQSLQNVSASRANAFALLLTPFLRPAIPGPVPLILIEA